MLKKEGLEGPGLDIIVPFLGASYVTIGSILLLAALLFPLGEACSVLVAYGLFFNIGQATVRVRLDAHSLYKPGMIAKISGFQFILGVLCLVIGIIGHCYKSY